mgnify:CR=1 FL=1
MAASFVGGKELDLRYDIPLEADVIVGGNSDAVEMPISNKYVSRRHFQVRQETDVYYISDLGSTNGTSYSFTVTATNANGNSEASSASNAVTPSVTP